MKYFLSLLLFFAAVMPMGAETVRVAMDEFPPMAHRNLDEPSSPFELGKHIVGFDADLMAAIAENNDWDIEVVWKSNVKEVLEAVSSGEADLGISGISITEAREEYIDFSHAYFDSGLMILAPADKPVVTMDNLKKAWPTLRNSMVALFVILFVFAHLIWIIERFNKSEDHFSSHYFKGVGQALWWSMVTSTTVGYGDIVPKTAIGRVVAGVVMIVGIAWFGLFISAMTSTFTVLVDDASITNLSDLQGKRIGTKLGSTSHELVKNLDGVSVTAYDHVGLMSAELLTDKIDAGVFDAPAIMYYAKQSADLIVASRLFNEQKYGIAMQSGSPIREYVNRSLLTLQEDGAYQEIYERWFGQQESK